MADNRPVLKKELSNILNSSGYIPLEYIRFNGSSYVTTSYVPYNDTRIVTKFDYTEKSSNTKWIFGSRKSVGSTGFCLLVLNGGMFRTDYASKSDNVSGVSATGMHTLDKNKNVTLMDGVTVTQTYSTFTCPVPMAIGAMNESAGIDDRCATMNLYYFKVYDNTTLALDLIPAMNSNTSKCGLYDKVNKHFYTATVGDFIAGPKANSFLMDADRSLELLEEASVATVGDLADILSKDIDAELKGKILTVDNLKAIIDLYR